MALKSQVFDNLLHFASASRSKAAVILAAVSFAICHLVLMGTTSFGPSADIDVEIPRQIIYLTAELCRFALPFGFMVAGFAIRGKKAPPSQIHR